MRGKWRLTGFYGYPEGSRRRDSWNFLRQLSQISNLPWCIIGDFNDILSSDEKKGRTDRANWLIHGFREAVSDAGLVDLTMENYQFTWFKSLGTARAVEEKLDRALSNNGWNQFFPNARLECLTATSSDHYPLLLLCDPITSASNKNKHFRATENEALVMKNILSIYEQASGQSINLQKSEIFCSKNVSDPVKNSISHILGVQQVLGTGRYLGLPSMVGRSRKATFRFIKDRIWKKINSWSSRCLSQAGREVMIKSVLQTIPSYIMSVFLIPHSLSDEIEKMLNSFWWGHNKDQSQGINWLSWERLSMHKSAGGLGFKSITAFNYAMLGKQAWKLLTNPGNLITRLFKAKYFPNSDFLSSSIGHNPSYVWRSIWSAKFVVRTGYKWSIGTGHNIPIWDSRWLSDGSILSQPTNMHVNLADMRVSDILEPNVKQWNPTLVTSMLGTQLGSRILKTPLFDSVSHDKIIWRFEKNGKYSVKSAYRYCIEDTLDLSHLKVPGDWNLVWQIQAPPKVKNFMWRLCRNCIPTRTRLLQKGVNCPGECVLCATEIEDSIHIILSCEVARQVWQKSGFLNTIQQHLTVNNNIADLVFSILQVLTAEQCSLFSTVLWSLWQSRNNKLWRSQVETASVVFDRACTVLTNWQTAQIAPKKGINGQQQPAAAKWARPSLGRYKCNIDASFSSGLNRVGIGTCIRDDQGRFVVAKTEWFSPVCDVEMGEAQGLLQALKWVRDLQLEDVDFELDAQTVVTKFHSKKDDVSEFGEVIKDCQRLHNTFFKNSKVEFIRRQANVVAHVLARAAPSLASFRVFTDTPICIHNFIINEMF
ncbi:unnamed protein product [Trifolium pratense]|uniref:Uncharacterized protein n=1 Tax=Trifolium pratense TaxID=57577 RepID=A0ACB0JK42_TRIPR|nr:unnamed protein product [Trifolium pratense]